MVIVYPLLQNKYCAKCETKCMISFAVGPSSLEVDGPSAPVVAGEYMILICTVEGAKPAANATWFNRSDVLNIIPEVQIDLAADGTFTTVSQVEVPVSRHDHLGTYYCKGTNSVLQSKGEAPLLKSLDIQVLCKKCALLSSNTIYVTVINCIVLYFIIYKMNICASAIPDFDNP